MVVTIVDFQVLHGDATGLGGLDLPGSATLSAPAVANAGSVEAGTGLQPGVQAASSAADWTALSQDPLFSDAHTQAALAFFRAQMYEAAAQAPYVPSADEQYDCGDGLFSQSAGVYLDNDDFSSNRASEAGTGVGGAVYFRNADQAQIRSSYFGNNTATLNGPRGVGGAFLGDTGDGLQLSTRLIP
jgi:hypothetical protein